MIKLWWLITVIALIEIAILKHQEPNLSNCGVYEDELNKVTCECTDNYTRFVNSYIFWTLGLTAYAIWRIVHYWTITLDTASRRTLKTRHRKSIFIFGILFVGLYGFMTYSFQEYRTHCTGSYVYTESEQMNSTLRTVCGIHFLFMAGSLIYEVVNFCIRSSKRSSKKGYESSDEIDDR